MDIYKLSISAKKILNRVIEILILLVGCLLLAILFPSFNGKYEMLGIGFFFLIMPNIVLLVEYLLITRKIEWVQFYNESFDIANRFQPIKRIQYKDITAIKLYMAAGLDKGNISFNSNEKFFFANIISADGSNVILTSLLGPDLRDDGRGAYSEDETSICIHFFVCSPPVMFLSGWWYGKRQIKPLRDCLASRLGGGSEICITNRLISIN